MCHAPEPGDDFSKCLESLRFKLEKNLDSVTDGTFDWIFSNDQFKDWQAQDTGTF